MDKRVFKKFAKFKTVVVACSKCGSEKYTGTAIEIGRMIKEHNRLHAGHGPSLLEKVMAFPAIVLDKIVALGKYFIKGFKK